MPSAEDRQRIEIRDTVRFILDTATKEELNRVESCLRDFSDFLRKDGRLNKKYDKPMVIKRERKYASTKG